MICNGQTAARRLLFSANESKMSNRHSQHFDKSALGHFYIQSSNLGIGYNQNMNLSTWISVNSCGYVSIQFHMAFSKEAIKTKWTDFLNNLLLDIVSKKLLKNTQHIKIIHLPFTHNFYSLPFSNFINRIVSTLMCWINSMSLKSGFSSLDELNSCNLNIMIYDLLSLEKYYFFKPWWNTTEHCIEIVET